MFVLNAMRQVLPLKGSKEFSDLGHATRRKR